MISCHENFSNETRGTTDSGKVAPTGKALSWLLNKWWQLKYQWQGACIIHENTRGKATLSHKHVCGNDILSGIIVNVANQF